MTKNEIMIIEGSRNIIEGSIKILEKDYPGESVLEEYCPEFNPLKIAIGNLEFALSNLNNILENGDLENGDLAAAVGNLWFALSALNHLLIYILQKGDLKTAIKPIRAALDVVFNFLTYISNNLGKEAFEIWIKNLQTAFGHSLMKKPENDDLKTDIKTFLSALNVLVRERNGSRG